MPCAQRPSACEVRCLADPRRACLTLRPYANIACPCFRCLAREREGARAKQSAPERGVRPVLLGALGAVAQGWRQGEDGREPCTQAAQHCWAVAVAPVPCGCDSVPAGSGESATVGAANRLGRRMASVCRGHSTKAQEDL